MRRFIASAALLGLTATPALADGHYSDLIRTNGITRAATEIAGQATLSPSDQFALGGLHFLAAVEGALQTRYAHDLNSDMLAMTIDLPFLRLPVAPNPAPQPFTGEVITRIFTDVLDDLARSGQALDQISDTDAVRVDIRPADIWFDINSNGKRDPGEGLAVVMNTVADTDDLIPQDMTIGFDTADAAWLSAYAHMLSGTADLILSTDPAGAVNAAFDGGARMDALRGAQPIRLGFFSENELGELDAIAAMIVALEGPLDPAHTRAAHQHFLDGLSDNRVFWSRLAQETDNRLEWIPNAGQTSVMPFQFPDGIGDSWQAVLADAEAVLTGDLLLPHWRLGDGAGLNLAQMMQDPPVIDIIGLFQGYALADYVQTGPLIDWQSMRDFDDMTGGNSPFFAIVLN